MWHTSVDDKSYCGKEEKHTSVMCNYSARLKKVKNFEI
jgi:hypothetical protein